MVLFVPRSISTACLELSATISTEKNFPEISLPTPIPANVILSWPTVILPRTLAAANVTALTIKVWEQRPAENFLVTDNSRTLEAQLTASVQPADIDILHDLFGLLNVPVLTILMHFTELHGTLNSSDFAHFRSQLSLSIAPNIFLQDLIGTHQLLHNQFAEAQQPLSELDKCHHFREAIKTLAHINYAIDSYLLNYTLSFVGNKIKNYTLQ